MKDDNRPPVMIFALRESNWLERVLFALVGAAILVLGFFFLAVALVAGAVLATAIITRWWWLSRKLRRKAALDVVEGEYTVVERATNSRSTLPPNC